MIIYYSDVYFILLLLVKLVGTTQLVVTLPTDAKAMIFNITVPIVFTN